jgi:hypothetical protein
VTSNTRSREEELEDIRASDGISTNGSKPVAVTGTNIPSFDQETIGPEVPVNLGEGIEKITGRMLRQLLNWWSLHELSKRYASQLLSIVHFLESLELGEVDFWRIISREELAYLENPDRFDEWTCVSIELNG